LGANAASHRVAKDSRVPPQRKARLKRYKSPGIDKIPAELIQVGGNTLRSEIHKRIWNKEEMPEQWKESIIVPIYKKGNKRDYNVTVMNFIQNLIQHSSV
jgi:hypothetical protein